MHPQYKLSKNDKLWYKDLFKKELIVSMNTSLINLDKYWDYIETNNIKLNYKKDIKKIEKSDIYKLIDLQFPDILDKQNRFHLTEILYPDQFQKVILGKNYKETFAPILYIDIFDIIYLYKVNFNSTHIIDYFIKKINLL